MRNFSDRELEMISILSTFMTSSLWGIQKDLRDENDNCNHEVPCIIASYNLSLMIYAMLMTTFLSIYIRFSQTETRMVHIATHMMLRLAMLLLFAGTFLIGAVRNINYLGVNGYVVSGGNILISLVAFTVIMIDYLCNYSKNRELGYKSGIRSISESEGEPVL